MKTLKEIAESLTVAAVMLLVLLPVRVLFVSYVSNNWLGSFGLITLVSVTILLLAKKNKLGWFGRAFIRQIFKVNKGKRKYFTWFNLIVGALYFTSIIAGVEVSNNMIEEKTQVLEELDVKNLQELQTKMNEKPMDWTQFPMAVLLFFYIMVFRFDLYALLIGSLNDISEGYFLHFSTVFLVEILEVMGILIYSKLYIKEEDSFK